MTIAEENVLIHAAVEKFPETFALRAWPDRKFRINQPQSLHPVQGAGHPLCRHSDTRGLEQLLNRHSGRDRKGGGIMSQKHKARNAFKALSRPTHRMPRVTVIPTVPMQCPCCLRDRAFKVIYHVSASAGTRLIDVRQWCDCQIDDATLRTLCLQAAQEHHNAHR